jgi:hypothetical protein
MRTTEGVEVAGARAVWPRIATDDHGMGFRVVLVLSAAVLVIVIDARGAGMARDGWTTKDTNGTKKWGVGRTRTQRSGTRTQRSGTRFSCASRSARESHE